MLHCQFFFSSGTIFFTSLTKQYTECRLRSVQNIGLFSFHGVSLCVGLFLSFFSVHPGLCCPVGFGWAHPGSVEHN